MFCIVPDSALNKILSFNKGMTRHLLQLILLFKEYRYKSIDYNVLYEIEMVMHPSLSDMC